MAGASPTSDISVFLLAAGGEVTARGHGEKEVSMFAHYSTTVVY